MPITVVLALGLDTALLEAQRDALRSAGYFVTGAGSLSAAMEEFREGDFDLVLMSESIPADSRERMIMMMRATGSRVPAVYLAETSNCLEALQTPAAGSAPHAVLRTIGELIEKPVVRASGTDSERLRRLAG
jgi:DNA-binding response OmpR family regulator